MFVKDMKSIIKYSMELDLLNLRTFRGYLGGDLLEIETEDYDTMVKIRNFCENISNSCEVKHKNNLYKIYCSFGEDRYNIENTSEQGIYNLK